jgi:hypothetical protein
MKLRNIAVGASVCVALVFGPAAGAFADNCYNASRPSGGLSSNPADFSAPVIKGQWVWLPSVGVPQPSWAFEVPANFQNSHGAESWLLAKTPYCAQGGVLFYNGPRTTTHGIQSGCGAFG